MPKFRAAAELSAISTLGRCIIFVVFAIAHVPEQAILTGLSPSTVNARSTQQSALSRS
jgi:hypothetical protein